jgi:predicted negative regulator of RcsB-dependent stress response
MATPLDLQEQEQVDELKAFWRRWGNTITWSLAAVLGTFAAYNAWNLYQSNLAKSAGDLFAQMQIADRAQDATRATNLFNDIKAKYASTAYAGHSGLLAAKVQAQHGKVDDALQTLAWLGDQAVEPEHRVIARMNAAGLLMDKKQFDEALKRLDGAIKPEGTLGALLADRRGDVLLQLGRVDDAKAAFADAHKAMDSKVDYRQLVEAKLASLGVAVGVAVDVGTGGAAEAKKP